MVATFEFKFSPFLFLSEIELHGNMCKIYQASYISWHCHIMFLPVNIKVVFRYRGLLSKSSNSKSVVNKAKV